MGAAVITSSVSSTLAWSSCKAPLANVVAFTCMPINKAATEAASITVPTTLILKNHKLNKEPHPIIVEKKMLDSPLLIDKE